MRAFQNFSKTCFWFTRCHKKYPMYHATDQNSWTLDFWESYLCVECSRLYNRASSNFYAIWLHMLTLILNLSKQSWVIFDVEFFVSFFISWEREYSTVQGAEWYRLTVWTSAMTSQCKLLLDYLNYTYGFAMLLPTSNMHAKNPYSSEDT